MKVLNLKSSQVLIEETTGQWLAMEKEGVELYTKFRNTTRPLNNGLNDFIDEVNAHLFRKEYSNDEDKGLSVLLTNQCNIECLHCYYCSSCNQPTSLKYDDEYRSFIKDYISSGLKWICFSGGEPLLNPYFNSFIEHAAENGLNISVLTNGTLINDSTADLLAKSHAKVQVSLDGTKNTYEFIRRKSSYDAAVRGIKKLTERGIITDISFLPCKLTINDFDNVIKVAKRYKVNLIHMPFLEHYGRAVVNYDILSLSDSELLAFLSNVINKYFAGDYGQLHIGIADELKKQLLYPTIINSCKACKGLILGLDYNNRVFPCSELIMDNYCIGSTCNSIKEIRENFGKLIGDLANISIGKMQDCNSCVFRAFCGGGCRVQALLSGGLYQPDKYCSILKELYTLILDKIIELDLE